MRSINFMEFMDAWNVFMALVCKFHRMYHATSIIVSSKIYGINQWFIEYFSYSMPCHFINIRVMNLKKTQVIYKWCFFVQKTTWNFIGNKSITFDRYHGFIKRNPRFNSWCSLLWTLFRLLDMFLAKPIDSHSWSQFHSLNGLKWRFNR